MDARERYARRVFETALYLQDMYEEKTHGDTRVIELLKPAEGLGNKAIRQFVLDDLYRRRGFSLTDATLEFPKWIAEEKSKSPYQLSEIERNLRSLCVLHERDVTRNRKPYNQKERAYLRAVRYMRRIPTEEVWAHSHLFDRFIADHFVPIGIGKLGGKYREHVVPCVYLRDEALKRIARGDSDEQVTEMLHRYLVIVKITRQEQKRLDRSKKAGGLGLKNSMPDHWGWGSGCIFQRLHDAAIEFSSQSTDFPTCNH